MPRLVDIELTRNTRALQELIKLCQHAMNQRWPEIDFYADVWPIHTLYKTKILDVRFGPACVDFKEAHESYLLGARCLVALIALEGKTKSARVLLDSWRLLRKHQLPIGSLRLHHLTDLEATLIRTARPTSANSLLNHLSQLKSSLERLAKAGVINNLGWSLSAANRAKLNKLIKHGQAERKEKRSIDILDRRIEALSDATAAMLFRDERLTATDRSAIAVLDIFMCAPSRINEPLCMTVTDRFTIEDYARRPSSDDAGKLFQVHQLLLMKGSKGAEWSAKPILNFMIDLSNVCWNTILELGQRSRMLLKHYEKTPDVLYLPPELEHFRGKPVSLSTLWKITNLTNEDPSVDDMPGIRKGVWTTILETHQSPSDAKVWIENPKKYRVDGQRMSRSRSKISALTWEATECYLLGRVRDRLESMRWVTEGVRYEGVLSEMLTLVDKPRMKYLPSAWSDSELRLHFKTPPWAEKQGIERNVFVKLDLKMTIDGSLVNCFIEPHDIRRWLTTKALDARERLSDVLINKWANRIDIGQLPAYDMRTAEQKADRVAVPVPDELKPITNGLKALAGIETEYGLKTEIILAHGDGLAVTSINAVMEATENRPTARSSDQIIILYPNRYGICLHQHHESPCRAYACPDGCNEQLTVKGHSSTNEEWRKRNELNNRSIINQLRSLTLARKRGIPDESAMLDQHLLTLIKGMDISTMADELIEKFQDFKHLIVDPNLKNSLEAAFVSRGIVSRLDNPEVPHGSLIKYHNPGKHAAPGFERAVEKQLGGRDEMHRQAARFHQSYPELAPKKMGLKDERHLLVSNDDEDENEQAA